MIVVCVRASVCAYVYMSVDVRNERLLYVENYSLISCFCSKLEMFQLVNLYIGIMVCNELVVAAKFQ